MILSKSQRIGAAVLFGIAFVAWVGYAVWPSRQPDLSNLSDPPYKKKGRTWEERKDSMRRADSVRYAQWSAEREQRYDSFRLADSLRRLERKAELLRYRDSARVADSLWRDSMGIRYTAHAKRDTVIDLNHCDTDDLLYIRGVGRYTAIQIIRYREQLGGYYSPAQLTDAPFAKCRLDTVLGSFIADTTAIEPMNINAVSLDRLQRHPYLRYDQAQAIYALRRKRVQLSSINDLWSLPELTEEDLHRLMPYLKFE
jgi:DNA uptake protein ComE-like DNA-binding protein